MGPSESGVKRQGSDRGSFAGRYAAFGARKYPSRAARFGVALYAGRDGPVPSMRDGSRRGLVSGAFAALGAHK